MKRSVGLFLLLAYEAAGLILYLQALYRKGPPFTLSVYTKADLLVDMAVPYSYSLFLLVPAAAGCIVLLHRHPAAAEMLLYGTRRKLFFWQSASMLAWNGMITAVYLAAVHGMGMFWGKENINWESPRSYFALIMKAVVPQASYAQVFLAQLAVLFLRNMIFMLAVMICWWGFSNVLYGVAAVSGICFVESRTAAFGLVLRNVSADYGFWVFERNKIRFLLASVFLVAALLAVLMKLVKEKEF